MATDQAGPVIVVDASLAVNALSEPGASGDRARSRLEPERDLRAPHLLDLEVANALRRRTAAGLLAAEQAAQALEDLSLIPLHRHAHGPLLHRIWALRDNATAYDASYLALAELLGCTLVTADAGLARVPAVDCPIEVVS